MSKVYSFEDCQPVVKEAFNLAIHITRGKKMKVYTLNSFAQNNETGFFDEYYDNHGVFIMKHFAEQFSHQHDLEHKELFGENLRYVIEEFEL